MESKEERILSEAIALPSVSSSYNISWDLMKNNFVELLLLTIISIAASIPTGLMRIGVEGSGFGAGGVLLGLFGIVFWLFISAPIAYGIAYVYLQLIRGEKFNVATVFDCFKTNYINVILANLLTSAIIIAGFLFLIIPGIIFACKLAFVPYLVMDKKMDAVEAVKTSWEMTKGHTLTIFLIGLLAIPIAIMGLLMLVVGLLPASIWIEGAFAAIYYSVDKQQNPEIEKEIIVVEE